MEMKRTKEANKYPHYYQHWGGHLPFPPQDCQFLDRSFVDAESKIRWLDFYYCSSKCPQPCARRKEYGANDNQEWKQELNRLIMVRKSMERQQ